MTNLLGALSSLPGRIIPGYIVGFPVIHSIYDTLTLIETLNYNLIHYRAITQTLTFTETLHYTAPNSGLIHDTLSFIEVITLNHLHNIFITDSLSFNETLHDKHIINRQIFDTFTFTDSFFRDRRIYQRVTDTLSFHESFNRNVIFNRSLADTLTFLDLIPAALNYATPIYIPTIRYNIFSSRFKPFVSLSSNGSLLHLPPPLLDNTFSLNNSVSIKKSMTNQVYSYIKRNPFTKLNFTFSLNRAQANALGKFYLNNSNKQITLIDWLGQQFIGFITIDNIAIIQKHAYDNQVELEFNGLRI